MCTYVGQSSSRKSRNFRLFLLPLSSRSTSQLTRHVRQPTSHESEVGSSHLGFFALNGGDLFVIFLLGAQVIPISDPVGVVVIVVGGEIRI